MARKRRLETSFVAFPLDRHSQDVGCPLQKGQVMGDELVLGAAVDLQHPKRLTVALEDDVHGAADTVVHKKLRGSKPLLVLKVIRDYGFAGPKCEPAGEARSTPIVATPTMPGSHPTPARTRNRFMPTGLVVSTNC
jgi:hypothetical protein